MSDFLADPNQWLPFTFAALMGLSILIYVVLDGFDLGVGTLFAVAADDGEKDRMIASIGPFWDANETWLVLAVGLLLVAFPVAHGVILSTLYVPVALMLVGLILRGVSFDFRAKVRPPHKRYWNRAFLVGSLMTALSQGFMLGLYIMGLEVTAWTLAFAGLTAICLTAGYAFIGACWLIHKMEDALQRKAVAWAKRLAWFVAAGFIAISLASPLVSPRIFDKWFSFPEIALLAPLPLLATALFVWVMVKLARLPAPNDRGSLGPFAIAIALFVLCFAGLAYSFYPYVVPDRLTIYDSASAPESLAIMLVGTLFVLPVIAGYSAFSYYVFRGKATDLSYD